MSQYLGPSPSAPRVASPQTAWALPRPGAAPDTLDQITAYLTRAGGAACLARVQHMASHLHLHDTASLAKSVRSLWEDYIANNNPSVVQAEGPEFMAFVLAGLDIGGENLACFLKPLLAPDKNGLPTLMSVLLQDELDQSTEQDLAWFANLLADQALRLGEVGPKAAINAEGRLSNLARYQLAIMADYILGVYQLPHPKSDYFYGVASYRAFQRDPFCNSVWLRESLELFYGRLKAKKADAAPTKSIDEDQLLSPKNLLRQGAYFAALSTPPCLTELAVGVPHGGHATDTQQEALMGVNGVCYFVGSLLMGLWRQNARLPNEAVRRQRVLCILVMHKLARIPRLHKTLSPAFLNRIQRYREGLLLSSDSVKWRLMARFRQAKTVFLRWTARTPQARFDNILQAKLAKGTKPLTAHLPPDTCTKLPADQPVTTAQKPCEYDLNLAVKQACLEFYLLLQKQPATQDTDNPQVSPAFQEAWAKVQNALAQHQQYQPPSLWADEKYDLPAHRRSHLLGITFKPDGHRRFTVGRFLLHVFQTNPKLRTGLGDYMQNYYQIFIPRAQAGNPQLPAEAASPVYAGGVIVANNRIIGGTNWHNRREADLAVERILCNILAAPGLYLDDKKRLISVLLEDLEQRSLGPFANLRKRRSFFGVDMLANSVTQGQGTRRAMGLLSSSLGQGIAGAGFSGLGFGMSAGSRPLTHLFATCDTATYKAAVSSFKDALSYLDSLAPVDLPPKGPADGAPIFQGTLNGLIAEIRQAVELPTGQTLSPQAAQGLVQRLETLRADPRYGAPAVYLILQHKFGKTTNNFPLLLALLDKIPQDQAGSLLTVYCQLADMAPPFPSALPPYMNVAHPEFHLDKTVAHADEMLFSHLGRTTSRANQVLFPVLKIIALIQGAHAQITQYQAKLAQLPEALQNERDALEVTLKNQQSLLDVFVRRFSEIEHQMEHDKHSPWRFLGMKSKTQSTARHTASTWFWRAIAFAPMGAANYAMPLMGKALLATGSMSLFGLSIALSLSSLMIPIGILVAAATFRAIALSFVDHNPSWEYSRKTPLLACINRHANTFVQPHKTAENLPIAEDLTQLNKELGDFIHNHFDKTKPGDHCTANAAERLASTRVAFLAILKKHLKIDSLEGPDAPSLWKTIYRGTRSSVTDNLVRSVLAAMNKDTSEAETIDNLMQYYGELEDALSGREDASFMEITQESSFFTANYGFVLHGLFAALGVAGLIFGLFPAFAAMPGLVFAVMIVGDVLSQKGLHALLSKNGATKRYQSAALFLKRVTLFAGILGQESLAWKALEADRQDAEMAQKDSGSCDPIWAAERQQARLERRENYLLQDKRLTQRILPTLRMPESRGQHFASSVLGIKKWEGKESRFYRLYKDLPQECQ